MTNSANAVDLHSLPDARKILTKSEGQEEGDRVKKILENKLEHTHTPIRTAVCVCTPEPASKQVAQVQTPGCGNW